MNPRAHILLIDDDQAFRKVTQALLKDEGYEVNVAATGQEAMRLVEEKDYDLILTDLVMEGVNGLDVLRHIRRTCPKSVVMMITGYASIPSAIEAIKLGAEDYLTKPCGNEELLFKIRKALEQKRQQEELEHLREEVEQRHAFGNIIGKSPRMQEVFRLIRQVAETDATVLIQGETGTGKELIARAIHYNSLRRDKPFVAVSCAALPETLLESELFGHEKGAFTGAVRQKRGRFELANQGTFFLDEVADMPLATQSKLLRVLQEREFQRIGGTETIKTDIRLISATNTDLRKAIDQGRFREDLFYRLNVMPITLPPLRERPEDIPTLALHFLKKFSTTAGKSIEGISESAMSFLMKYPWPGNVRELENLMERAVILCRGDLLRLEHLVLLKQEVEANLLSQAKARRLTERELNRLYARMILEEFQGNKREACKALGVNFRTLQKRLRDG